MAVTRKIRGHMGYEEPHYRKSNAVRRLVILSAAKCPDRDASLRCLTCQGCACRNGVPRMLTASTG